MRPHIALFVLIAFPVLLGGCGESAPAERREVAEPSWPTTPEQTDANDVDPTDPPGEETPGTPPNEETENTPDESRNPCETDNGGCGDPLFWNCSPDESNEPVCTDIDECANEPGPCDPLTECINQEGARPICGECPEGYRGNGYDGCFEDGQEPGTCEGDFTLTTSAELETIYYCSSITGDLTITSPEFTQFTLPYLSSISGSLLVVSSESLFDLVVLSELSNVGGSIKIENKCLVFRNRKVTI